MKKRIDWIDTAKGIGIVLTVFAHAGFTVLTPYIYSFHMPLFFFLSGRLFSENDSFLHFLAKKIKSIIIPYFSYASLILFFNVIANKFGFISFKIPNFIYEVLVQERFLTLWFLAALFWLNITLYFLIKIENRYRINISLIIFCMLVLGLLWYGRGGGALFWDFDITFTALPFFYFGYLLKINKYQINTFIEEHFSHKELPLGMTCLVLGLLLNSINRYLSGSYLDMYFCNYGFAPLTYISAFLNIFGICFISKIIKFKMLRYFGSNSMIFFALHQSISKVLFQIVILSLPLCFSSVRDILLSNFYVYSIALVIFTFASLTPINNIFKRIYITKILFGLKN